jgi:glutamate--cysteine ligase
VLEIAAAGLTERANLNAAGDNESGFLDPLRDVVASGKTFADRLLDRYHGDWRGDVSRVYEEFSF